MEKLEKNLTNTPNSAHFCISLFAIFLLIVEILSSGEASAQSKDLSAASDYAFMSGCFNPSYAEIAINTEEAILNSAKTEIDHFLIEFFSRKAVGKQDNEVLFSVIKTKFNWNEATRMYLDTGLNKCAPGYFQEVFVTSWRLNYKGGFIGSQVIKRNYKIDRTNINDPQVKFTLSFRSCP